MKMLSTIGFVFLATLVWTIPSFAMDKEYHVDLAKSTFDFSFKSTLHPVSGEVHQFSGKIIADIDKGIDLKNGKFVFDVNSMDTDEPKRDENMRTMLQAHEYSNIVFEVESAELVRNETTVIHGQLTIRDVKLPLDIPAKVIKADGGLILSGEVPLSLKKFALRPPSVMMFIRVFDRVKTNFTFYLKENV